MIQIKKEKHASIFPEWEVNPAQKELTNLLPAVNVSQGLLFIICTWSKIKFQCVKIAHFIRLFLQLVFGLFSSCCSDSFRSEHELIFVNWTSASHWFRLVWGTVYNCNSCLGHRIGNVIALVFQTSEQTYDSSPVDVILVQIWQVYSSFLTSKVFRKILVDGLGEISGLLIDTTDTDNTKSRQLVLKPDWLRAKAWERAAQTNRKKKIK